MPTATPTPASAAALTGPQKAAVMLIQMGRERSAKVLAAMEEHEIEELTSEIVKLGELKPELADAVLLEFYGQLTGSGPAGSGGMGFARALLESSLGREKASSMLDRVASSQQGQPFDFLQEADARQIVSFVNGEHPQTVALVLAHLRPEQASGALAGLPSDLQAEVAHRIATMERTSPDVISVVAETISRKASTVLTPQAVSVVGGVQPLVEIINRADPGTEKHLLEELAKRDAALAELVRSQMFTFEDILGLEDRALQLVLREVQAADLALALKGVRTEVRDKILGNVSERARENLLEEIELLGQVRMSQVEEARAVVVTAIRKLEETGQITIRRDSDDEYVA
ncbi:flagellar motor switch protein FliG [Quadrisphaera sp. DSM 44207]|uniref:flagellar motor switch protein FliG n=1 Tax=Quadrisphaera sp. DSM 44207 TaxID=1881057 RepID=UPI00088EE7F9|nr:flagellar motor switch protein FliG [Quadrisphaera sp. DSM 44207]SDQ20111.1 flagellar motor switch protein FliG [Quadrisphaera sp. DSM 44207]